MGPEACLSIPDWYGDVPRAMNVTVKARNEDDREVRVKASGYLARILQHEIDHLDGILFIDRVEDRSTLQHVSDADLEEAEDEDEVLVGGGDAYYRAALIHSVPTCTLGERAAPCGSHSCLVQTSPDWTPNIDICGLGVVGVALDARARGAPLREIAGFDP